MTDCEEIRDLISKEEIIFEEKYSTSSLQMRKSLILDDFQGLKILKQQKFEEIKESMNENDVDVVTLETLRT